MNRYRVSVEVMADDESEAASEAAKTLAIYPSNATIEFLISAAYIESMKTKASAATTEPNP